MASWERVGQWTAWISSLAEVLDRRCRWRLAPLLLGVLWATGRRTVARWITAGGLSDQWQRYYGFLWTVGRHAGDISLRLVWLAFRIIPVDDWGQFICLALDDTPTAR
jgi:hypothetical protein